MSRHAYAPRRCSDRWLDADCPEEILAIIDLGANETDRYDVFYAELFAHDDPRGPWLSFYSLDVHGYGYHGELQAHQVAAYRYRMKHRYAKWSTLPDAVKDAVRRDIQDATAFVEDVNA